MIYFMQIIIITHVLLSRLSMLFEDVLCCCISLILMTVLCTFVPYWVFTILFLYRQYLLIRGKIVSLYSLRYTTVIWLLLFYASNRMIYFMQNIIITHVFHDLDNLCYLMMYFVVVFPCYWWLCCAILCYIESLLFCFCSKCR